MLQGTLSLAPHIHVDRLKIRKGSPGQCLGNPVEEMSRGLGRLRKQTMCVSLSKSCHRGLKSPYMFEANNTVLSIRMQIIYYFSSSDTITYNYLN